MLPALLIWACTSGTDSYPGEVSRKCLFFISKLGFIKKILCKKDMLVIEGSKEHKLCSTKSCPPRPCPTHFLLVRVPLPRACQTLSSSCPLAGVSGHVHKRNRVLYTVCPAFSRLTHPGQCFHFICKFKRMTIHAASYPKCASFNWSSIRRC